MAPGPTRTADIDRSRLSDGIFLLVGCACDGNDNSDPLCHHDIAAGNRDRRCEHGSGFADQALGFISQLARIPELLFDAAIDRISNRRWRNSPCLLLSSLQSRLAGSSLGKTSVTREKPWRANHCDRFGARSFVGNFGPSGGLWSLRV